MRVSTETLFCKLSSFNKSPVVTKQAVNEFFERHSQSSNWRHFRVNGHSNLHVQATKSYHKACLRLPAVGFSTLRKFSFNFLDWKLYVGPVHRTDFFKRNSAFFETRLLHEFSFSMKTFTVQIKLHQNWVNYIEKLDSNINFHGRMETWRKFKRKFWRKLLKARQHCSKKVFWLESSHFHFSDWQKLLWKCFQINIVKKFVAKSSVENLLQR